MKQPLQTRAQVHRELGHFTGLLVTGPQRSGTRIAAMMLSQDLGLALVEDQDHGNDLDAVKEVLRNTAVPAVVQAPDLSMHLDELRPMPGVCVVWMLRRREDVIASQVRVGAGDRLRDQRLQVWRAHTALQWVELEYAAPYVQNHILYVPREERIKWTAKQTAHQAPTVQG